MEKGHWLTATKLIYAVQLSTWSGYVTSALQFIGRLGMADIRWIYDGYTDDLRLTYGGHRAFPRLTDNWHMADIRRTCGWHAVDIRRTYGWQEADIRPFPGWHKADILLTYGWNTADIRPYIRCMCSTLSKLKKSFSIRPYVSHCRDHDQNGGFSTDCECRQQCVYEAILTIV